MSSSDRLYRPNLTKLDRETPPKRENSFRGQVSFERVAAGRTAPIHPDEAYKNGLVDGEQRGRQAALKELEPILEEFRTLSRAMVDARQERIDQAERELYDIAVRIASRILHGELTQGSDVVVRMARACIQEAQAAEGLMTLHVAPVDVELIRTHLPELEVDLADASLRIAADESLHPGEVILETERRCYDGRAQRLLDAATGTGPKPGGSR